MFGNTPTIVCARAVERDAAADYIRIAAEPFLPEIFRDHRHIGALFFFRQKIAAENRTHAEHVEIVRRHSPAEDLDGVAQTRQREGKDILGSEAVEERLSIAVMLKARRGDARYRRDCAILSPAETGGRHATVP